jgi:type III secretion system low calcium response chaperone LcrH/SycD
MESKNNASSLKRRPEIVSADAPFEGVENGGDENLKRVSPEAMGGINRYVYDLYRQGRLHDAEILFRSLFIYDFRNADYAMGFATVCYLQKNYLKALDLYALAFDLSKNDYRSMFCAAQCQLMRGEAALARRCLVNVVECSDDERLKEMTASFLQNLDEIDCGQKQHAFEEMTVGLCKH